MAHIIDTAPEFEAYAREAAMESPVERERLWRVRYEACRPDLFEAFRAAPGVGEGNHALVRDLSSLREQARRGAPVVRALIEELEPAVAEALGVAADPSPVHVLLVGNASANAAVGRLASEVVLFHCLEWFHSPESARIVVAHEDAHAWHRIALKEQPPADDLAWATFSEGLAIQASRAVVPGQPEGDYFWYGYAGFDEWLAWCRERSGDLRGWLAAALDEPDATEAFFGGGTVEGQSRVGYFVADELVASLGRPLTELVAMTVQEARAAVVDVLSRA